MTTPDWFAVVVLALATARTVRLIGWDTITDRPRRWLTGWTDDGLRVERRPDRIGLRKFLSCPWCAGTWHMAAWYAAYQVDPRWTIIVAAPVAAGEVVGLIVKHLDQ